MNKKFKFKKLALVLLPLMVGTTQAAYNDDQELSNQGRMAMSGGSISGEQSLAAPTKTTAQKSNSTAATQKTGNGFKSANLASDDEDITQRKTVNNGNLAASLLQQARFWHDKGQTNKAIMTLKRVLLTNPNHEESLYLLTVWSSEVGDKAGAQRYKDKLTSVAPQSSYLQELDNQKGMASLSQDVLSHARALARSGNVPGAIKEYQKLFNGVYPPKSLVSEYYLTLSGDPKYYDRAVTGLQNYMKVKPTDVNAQVTYGKILSYRQSSIRDGIEILSYYSKTRNDAAQALRQSLMWLQPTAQDEKYYAAYAKKYPNDTEVRAHYDSAIVGNLNKKAQGNTDKQDAIRDLKNLLAKNPRNQDALEAIGYLYLEQNDFANASLYLQHAAELGGSKQNKLNHDALIAKARGYIKAGQVDNALNTAEDCLKLNDKDIDALMLKAEICQKLNLVTEEEKTLNNILALSPQNQGAQEMMYYFYKNHNAPDKAKALLATLPISLQNKIINQSKGVAYVDPIPPIRNKAQGYVDSGDIASAMTILENGIAKYPNNTWLHNDLAKIQMNQGLTLGFSKQISYLTRNGASNDDLLAAANLLNEAQDYNGALNALSRCNNNAKAQALRNDIRINQSFISAENYLERGNSQAAINSLNSLQTSVPSLTTSQIGHLAYLYLKAGNRDKALEYANLATSKPAQMGDSLATYSDVITVFNETGNYDRARELSQNQGILANSDPNDVSNIEIGDTIRKADSLRNIGRSADAYDLLYPMIEQHPNDPALNMAMARLYQEGGFYNTSYSIYKKVLVNNPNSQEARIGAVNAAMGARDYSTAYDLAQSLDTTNDPAVLTLKAKLDAKNKHYFSAMSKLSKARSLLDSRYNLPVYAQGIDEEVAPSATKAPGNPFANRHSSSAITESKEKLPWELPTANQNVSYAFNMSAQQRKEVIDDINFTMRELQDKVATTVKVRLMASQKDGEDGLSKLKTAQIPITVATPVLGGAKLSGTITPITMDSGSANQYGAAELGTNMLNAGVSKLVSNINSMIDNYSKLKNQIINSNLGGTVPGEDEFMKRFKAQYGFANVSDADVKRIVNGALLNAQNFDLSKPEGRQNLIKYFQSFDTPAATMAAVNSNFSNEDVLPGASHVHKSSGVGFNLALEDDNYKFDFGVTPVGKDSTTVVGGAFYNLQTSKNSAFRFTAERRAMTDSLLSYYGMVDNNSGTYWGGVTKNGGRIEFASDDGFFGYSLAGSYYQYRGDNVKKNSSYGLSAVAYVHPFKPTAYEDMTIGISLSYENYDNNQNHFSFGHGGYFSPQNYLIAAIPFTYKLRNDKYDIAVDASLGYQTYVNDEADFFPGHDDLNKLAQTLNQSGLLKRAKYEREDESGVGGSIKANLDYYLLDDLVLGGQIGYSTFGEYKEMSEMLYIKSVLGE